MVHGEYIQTESGEQVSGGSFRVYRKTNVFRRQETPFGVAFIGFLVPVKETCLEDVALFLVWKTYEKILCFFSVA